MQCKFALLSVPTQKLSFSFGTRHLVPLFPEQLHYNKIITANMKSSYIPLTVLVLLSLSWLELNVFISLLNHISPSLLSITWHPPEGTDTPTGWCKLFCLYCIPHTIIFMVFHWSTDGGGNAARSAAISFCVWRFACTFQLSVACVCTYSAFERAYSVVSSCLSADLGPANIC